MAPRVNNQIRTAAPGTDSARLEAYYTQPELWDLERFEGSADQRLRARLIAAMVDPQAETVLDVGCGNGFVTRRLRARRLVVGLDPSAEALACWDGVRVLASGARLPFPDRSFDTVVSCEVLEHLPDGLFEQVTAELARVARRSLVIGVPYRQDLRQGMTRCADCGEVYHVDLHRRSFRGPEDVLRAFPGFRLEVVGLHGPPQRNPLPAVSVDTIPPLGTRRAVGLRPLPRLRLRPNPHLPRRKRKTPPPLAPGRPGVADEEGKFL